MAAVPDVPDLLAAPHIQAVLRAHPNTHALAIGAPPHALLAAYLSSAPPPSTPLAACIAAVRHHQLPRAPIALHAPPVHAQGMSPKKAHEVARMSAYIVALVRANDIRESTLRIVDVGAGQGYLTRALKARLPAAHVLALDADAAQTAGAQKWERRVLKGVVPPIAHRTVLVGEETLVGAVDGWLVGEGRSDEAGGDGARAPAPVLFVALHACGSLTPDVLRAVLDARRCRRRSSTSAWYPLGAVAVGCCYNLMRPADFPLSAVYRTHRTPPSLPPAAFHLAAQVPSTWVADPSAAPLVLLPSAALAIRKVVWRALLERALLRAVPAPVAPQPTKPSSATVPAHWPRRPEQWSSPPIVDATTNTHLAPASGMGLTPAMHRLGRLHDAAYTGSWAAFLALAAQRMGVAFPPVEEVNAYLASSFKVEAVFSGTTTLQSNEDEDRTDTEIIGALPVELHAHAQTLAALHVLRCIVGVLVETAVLLDRVQWVKEELALATKECDEKNVIEEREKGQIGDNMQVASVNLFDQNTGSGRNVAIVLAPSLPSTS